MHANTQMHLSQHGSQTFCRKFKRSIGRNVATRFTARAVDGMFETVTTKHVRLIIKENPLPVIINPRNFLALT